MIDIRLIAVLLGGVLLVLGVLSGIALFIRAFQSVPKDSAGEGTLWGLFLICTTAGMIILVNIH